MEPICLLRVSNARAPRSVRRSPNAPSERALGRRSFTGFGLRRGGLRRLAPLAVLLGLAAMPAVASAGNVTVQGAVTLIPDGRQVARIGVGRFNEASSGQVPANVYASQGLTWHSGPLSSMLPGVTNPGSCESLPVYQAGSPYFPNLHANGSEQTGA